jgi:hypothetical protein
VPSEAVLKPFRVNSTQIDADRQQLQEEEEE